MATKKKSAAAVRRDKAEKAQRVFIKKVVKPEIAAAVAHQRSTFLSSVMVGIDCDMNTARSKAFAAVVSFANLSDPLSEAEKDRGLALNAEIVARAARGRATCLIYSELFQEMHAKISPAVNTALTEWLRDGKPADVWRLVYVQSNALVTLFDGNQTDIAIYVVYRRLWDLAVELESDSTKFLDPDTLEHVFGLRV